MPIPTALSASAVGSTSFVANWTNVNGVASYHLDVSTNSSFVDFVPGYQDLSVGNATSFSVTNLASGFTYYLRVRADNGYAISASSNTISVTISGPPAITSQPQNRTVTAGQNATFTVVANGIPTPTYQ